MPITPLQRLDGLAAIIDEDNIDTDAIVPARFLLRLEREGMGECLFRDRRYEADGTPKPDFVLNQKPYDTASILVTGANFGCGSSREQAVWALVDAGIRCVIAPSFGDIFFNNATKNGLLTLVVTGDDFARVREAALAGATLSVDVASQTLSIPGEQFSFAMDAHSKRAMMEGLDEIGVILADSADKIDAFEARHRARYDWSVLDAQDMQAALLKESEPTGAAG
jgi:3-isopropylmalate/(R)-2-methylmalate dehydratase small subunit